MTAEEADKITRSYKPAGILSEVEKEERIQIVKRLLEFERKRMDAQMQKLPAEVKDLDHTALTWIASRCVDSRFRSSLEGVVSSLIESGHLFCSGNFQLVNTIIRRLQTVAAKPQPKSASPESLFQPRNPCKEAQAELATIVARFIIAKAINKSFAMAWVVEEAKREHFKSKWASMRRQAKPHDLIQLKFIFDAIVKFDSVMKDLFNGPLKWQDERFPQPRSDAADYMVGMENFNATLAAVVNRFLDVIETMQAESTYALGLNWSGGWTELRYRQQERVIKILEPYVQSEWETFKRERPALLEEPYTVSRIAKRSWKIVWQSLSKPLATTLSEFCFPPIDSAHGDWFIPKHSSGFNFDRGGFP